MPDKHSNFLTLDPETASTRDIHHLLLGGVTPRPIALVSTISAAGIPNLAPFSFYNAFGANPPFIAFSPANGGRDGSTKDTLKNVREVPECVVHAVPYTLVEQVNLSSNAFAPEIDEFTKSGLTGIPSDLVKPARVLESPFHMECKVEQIIPLGGVKGSGNLVLCQVVKFHFTEAILTEGIIDPQKIDLVGRNSANFYTRASGSAIFEVKKPQKIGMGIDQLPPHIKNSTILTANNLAQLGGLDKLPESAQVAAFIESTEQSQGNESPDADKRHIINFNRGYALRDSDPQQARILIETAAQQALALNDLDFAIKVLMIIPSILS